MKQLTPSEFYDQWQLEDTNSGQRFCFDSPDGNYAVWPDSVVSLMQAYAEHIEEMAWVTDGSLPPVDGTWGNESASIEVVAETVTGTTQAYCDLENKFWFSIKGTRIIPLKWRPLPTPPKP